MKSCAVQEQGSDQGLPSATVVIPCRNEAAVIERCLRSIAASEYPIDRLEVLVVDGMSTDGTRPIVQDLAREFPFVRLLDNPDLTIPHAMNRGLRAGAGEVALKMDAHSKYPPDYIRRTVSLLTATGAEMVGGVIDTLPRNGTPQAVAIAAALSHAWGSFGSSFRLGAKGVREADAVAFGCWRREYVLSVGGFDTRLTRSSDIELSSRIRRRGGRIVLSPAIRAGYYSAGALREFAAKNWHDGKWAVLPYRHVRHATRLRHLFPMVALAVWISLLLGGFAIPLLHAVLTAASALYLLLCAVFSAEVGLRRRWPILAIPCFAAFLVRHWVYAAGSLWATVSLLRPQRSVIAPDATPHAAPTSHENAPDD